MDANTTAAADATLAASRALLGVVARSLGATLDTVSLPQFRVLVVLSAAGPTRMSTLADTMGAVPSTFSRSIDRMVAGGWVERLASPESRREVLIALAPAGRALVDDVTDRRRLGIAAILATLSAEQQDEVRRALDLFAAAAGETTAADLLALGV